jgi:hypothetical protein
MVVAGTVSSGGLAAIAVELSRKKKDAAKSIPNSNQRSGADINTHSS